MWDYLAAGLIVAGLLLGWLAVQAVARAYAARHPQFGPTREEGGGCGGGCACTGGACGRADGTIGQHTVMRGRVSDGDTARD